ncbi:MAG: hypothetical protein ACTSYD_13945 [Candidatus Heimdallarchaeaceae archaeon]
MSWTAFFTSIGILLFVSSILALIVALSARKIDFGERLLSRPFFQRLKRFRDTPILPGEKVKPLIEGNKMKSRRARKSVETESLREIMPSEGEEILFEEEDMVTPSTTIDTETSVSAPSLPLDIEKAETVEGTFTRDLAIRLPKNMCLDEVFRLKIILSKTEEYSEELEIKEIELDKKEAKFFALNTAKLGTTIEEATTIIKGLEEGPLTIRPIAIGNVASIAPSSRTIFFDPAKDTITAEFFITPTKWSKELVSTLRIEFEQKHVLLKVVNLPIRIYKHKLEALFGLNISKVQQTILIVYSVIGTLLGFLSTFQNKIIPLIQGFLS